MRFLPWKANCEKTKSNSKKCFKPPSSSWTGNNDDKEFAPFIFFETVEPPKANDPEGIADYVKQFVYYINQLLSDSNFCDFGFHEFVTKKNDNKNKSIAEFGNKIDSDFFTKCDEADLKLFKDSGLLYIWEQLVDDCITILEDMRFIEYLKKNTCNTCYSLA